MGKIEVGCNVVKIGSAIPYTVIEKRPGKFYGPLLKIRNDFTGAIENVLQAHVRFCLVIN